MPILSSSNDLDGAEAALATAANGPGTPKKPSYPISPALRTYLSRCQRELDLPVSYEQLRSFREAVPLADAEGRDSLWETVIYPSEEFTTLRNGLKYIYALLKVDGDLSVMEHLYIDRVDFCSFGNSLPFRIRIVNGINQNPDYFYIKQADASRVYGLELEHLLSPNRLNYFTHAATLVEEHIAGLPGDVFIDRWLGNRELKPIRIAKELVKFNERCFIRLLGDMRSYNFVVVLTPDFEGWQVRIRAMDFDQQSHSGRRTFYLPQFFKENLALVKFCTQQLDIKTAYQYQREERTLMLQRYELAQVRLDLLLDTMEGDVIAPVENLIPLRQDLARHFEDDRFLACESMGALVRQNLRHVRDEDHRTRP
ncbi:MAG TPA: hypothetical protein VFH73_12625 [Polyangia bacterium]|jgi:hypothetical protein|nr:hypothetical protein [Polyangia bacterium]